MIISMNVVNVLFHMSICYAETHFKPIGERMLYPYSHAHCNRGDTYGTDVECL